MSDDTEKLAKILYATLTVGDLEQMTERDDLKRRIAELEQQTEAFKDQIQENENTWLGICGYIAELEDFMESADTWENADPEDLYQFDPWACLRESLRFMKELKRHKELLQNVCLYAMRADAFATEAAVIGRVETVHALFSFLKVAINSAVSGGAVDRAWCDHLNLIDMGGASLCTRCGATFAKVAIDGGALESDDE